MPKFRWPLPHFLHRRPRRCRSRRRRAPPAPDTPARGAPEVGGAGPRRSIPTPDTLGKRIRRAAESILDNERLTAGLDDSAAKVLLDWGVALAERAVRHTAGEGDAAAEEDLADRLRATRRLMRLVDRWVTRRPDMDAEVLGELWDDIVAQASAVYGRAFAPSDVGEPDPVEAKSGELGAAALIARLRARFEDAEPPQGPDHSPRSV